MARRSKSGDPEALKDAFRRAAEIAAVVPESMQEAAFHRALDQILAGQESTADSAAGHSRRGPSTSTARETSPGDPAKRLIEGINRTAHPEITSATKVLDRALAVVRLASRDFDIDGLSAPEIAKVLTEKFRQRTSRQAVTQALGSAHAMVDTGTRGRVTIYRIMQSGEDYLDAGGSEGQAGENGSSRQSPTPGRPRRRKRTTSPKRDKPATKQIKAASTIRTGRRRGPKSVLGELIDEGFFGTARTMSEAQEQLKHKKGVRLTLQDLSPAFVRLLREGRLDRDRNASGQYEYRAK
jgi:hypothetical protein